MIRFPNPRLNPHPSTIHTLAPRWCPWSSLSGLPCPVLPCHFDSQALLSLLLCCTTTATSTTTTHCQTRLQPACIASLPRQSRTRSPAHRSSGGLTAQPTLASHRIADWPSAACSPWSRLDQLSRQTPPAAFATLATSSFTPVLHLLDLRAAHSSRSACATRLRSLPDWLQSLGAFAPSHPRATSHCNCLRSRHCHLAVQLPRRIYYPARKIVRPTNLPLELKIQSNPIAHQHYRLLSKTCTLHSGTQTLLPIAARRIAK